jgi:hypothetical protein
MQAGQAVAASKSAGKVTFFTVLWFCVFVLSGLSVSAYFHPANPLLGVALFVVGFFLPLLLSQLVIKLFGKR